MDEETGRQPFDPLEKVSDDDLDQAVMSALSYALGFHGKAKGHPEQRMAFAIFIFIKTLAEELPGMDAVGFRLAEPLFGLISEQDARKLAQMPRPPGH